MKKSSRGPVEDFHERTEYGMYDGMFYEELEDDGTSDICPTCKKVYRNCTCGHEGDEPNW